MPYSPFVRNTLKAAIDATIELHRTGRVPLARLPTTETLVKYFENNPAYSITTEMSPEEREAVRQKIKVKIIGLVDAFEAARIIYNLTVENEVRKFFKE